MHHDDALKLTALDLWAALTPNGKVVFMATSIARYASFLGGLLGIALKAPV